MNNSPPALGPLSGEPDMNEGTHYDTLGLAPDASSEQIKRVYRSQMRTAHPDRGGSSTEASKLTAAYNVLKDPRRRVDYDLRIGTIDNDNDDDLDPESADDEVVDDWGAEVPTPRQAQGRQPPPRAYPHPAHTPPPAPAPWPWEPAYQGPPIPTAVRPWHRIWLVGHGRWTWAARILSCVVLAPLVSLPLLDIVAMTIGQAPWSRLPTDAITFLLISAFILLPIRRRGMGGKIHWKYSIFALLFIGAPALATAGVGGHPSSPAWPLLGIGVTIILATEVRHFAIATGRARAI
jgi:hypothetical protein